MNKLVAYFDSSDLKSLYLDRVREHQWLDQLVQGQGHFDGKGCAVACTMHEYNHAAYETEIGVPVVLARLEDYIFEGLPIVKAKAWPAAFLAAIPVGADLSMVWPRFAVWLLRDELKQHDKAGMCERVAVLYDRWISGDKPTGAEWRETRRAAASASAAASAARAAALAASAAAHAADSNSGSVLTAAREVAAVVRAMACSAPHEWAANTAARAVKQSATMVWPASSATRWANSCSSKLASVPSCRIESFRRPAVRAASVLHSASFNTIFSDRTACETHCG